MKLLDLSIKQIRQSEWIFL